MNNFEKQLEAVRAFNVAPETLDKECGLHKALVLSVLHRFEEAAVGLLPANIRESAGISALAWN